GVLFQIIGHCRIIICITGKHGIVKYQRGEASDIGRLPPPRVDIVVVGVVFHYLTAALTTTVSPFTVSETDWTSNDASSSLFVMMTGEMVLFASSFTRSISKVTSLSPTSTLSPSETKPRSEEHTSELQSRSPLASSLHAALPIFHYLTAALTTTVSPFTVSETDWTSNDASSSLFVMMTGEMVLFASSFTRSISKVTSLSPTSTLSPSETKPSNPLPSIATFSRP